MSMSSSFAGGPSPEYAGGGAAAAGADGTDEYRGKCQR